MSSSTIIDSESALRTIIKPYPKLMDKRIQTSLDKHCLEFIQHARIAAIGFNHNSLGIQVINLTETSLNIINPTQLKVTLENMATLANQEFAIPYSAYFLIPGVGHGLRVNGLANIKSEDNSHVTLDINAAYFQCSRASVRANLWEKSLNQPLLDNKLLTENPSNTLTEAGIYFLSMSSYLLLFTKNKQCQTEISPRGDEGQIAIPLDNKTLLIAERPGNKVAISLRNIIEQPSLILSFILTGCDKVLQITGEACITKDEALLKPLSIKGKVPKLGILVTITEQKIMNIQGLKGLTLWDDNYHIDIKSLTAFPKIMAEHMNGKGLLGKASAPIMKAIVNHDLKNLY
jgi:predicted pyridoxine 5'-phosphate oxidase superfamily flavin-nucleotide-binding protein